MKKYGLLKDLPGLKAGAMFIPTDNNRDGYSWGYNFRGDSYDNLALCYFKTKAVEDNPEWFALEEGFIHTKDDMLRFGHYIVLHWEESRDKHISAFMSDAYDDWVLAHKRSEKQS